MAKDRETEIIQVEFAGKPFRRRIEVGKPNESRLPMQTRRVRIVQTLRPDSGTIAFRSAGKIRGHQPSDYPHFPLKQSGGMYDTAYISRSQSTAQKEGASSLSVDTEEEYLKRGGQGIRIPKRGGFFSSREKRLVHQIRLQRGPRIEH